MSPLGRYGSEPEIGVGRKNVGFSASRKRSANAARPCPLWVNRVILAVGRLLPVFPRKRTSSRPVGMSHTCDHQTLEPARQ